jgi:hypothetical protein
VLGSCLYTFLSRLQPAAHEYSRPPSRQKQARGMWHPSQCAKIVLEGKAGPPANLVVSGHDFRAAGKVAFGVLCINALDSDHAGMRVLPEYGEHLRRVPLKRLDG